MDPRIQSSESGKMRIRAHLVASSTRGAVASFFLLLPPSHPNASPVCHPRPLIRLCRQQRFCRHPGHGRLRAAQEDLAAFDGVPPAKYTAGLGQSAMAVTGDNEDAQSMALNAVSELIARYKVDPKSIARLCVGTESQVDKSKSMKTTLLQLFPESNGFMDGVDAVNACYGGTEQVLNSINAVRNVAEWEEGKVAIVVATDVAARGLDVDDITHVINYDLPHVAEDYIHRIGRTGRAGQTGHAISLVTDEDVAALKAIEELIGETIEQCKLE